MPIYEYRCTQCGHEHDALQKFSDAPLTTCPSCHQDALVKKLSAAGFQLKGSGWYVTDFRSKSSGGGKPAAGDAAKAEASPGGEGKTETKSDSKSESKSESSAGDTSSGSAAKSCSPGCGCH